MSTPTENEVIDVTPTSTGSGLKVNDVLYILFRHKWLIAICTAVGLAAAAGIYLRMKPGYMAVAKLLVRAVVETGISASIGTDQQVRNPDSRGEGIMNSELEILTSKDLALSVVDAIGMDGFKSAWPDATNKAQIASAVLAGLQPVVPGRSTTITVRYHNPDPELAQRVLTELIDGYLAKHIEIHRAAGVYESLARTVDQIRARLEDTEKELQQIRTKAGVSVGSFEEAKISSAQRLDRIAEEIRLASAAYSEQQARLKELDRWQSTTAAAPSEETNAPAPPGENVLRSYRELNTQLTLLIQRRTLDLTQFTPESIQIQQLQRRIDELESQKKKLEEEHPMLVRLGAPIPTDGGSAVQGDLRNENATLAAIQAKIQTLTNQLQLAAAESVKLDEVSYQMSRLEQQRSLDRTNLVSLSSKLEQAKFDEALDPSRVPNISVIQKPSLFAAEDTKRIKLAGGAAFGGLALGIAIAFLIELVLDQRVRKASEVENRLGLPLLLTVPVVKGLGKFTLALPPAAPDQPHRAPDSPIPILPSLMGPQSAERKAQGAERKAQSAERQAQSAPSSASPSPISHLPSPTSDFAPWQAQHVLRPYFEALRDRMMLYFQLNRMHHKPKLVAVTGCGQGAGTTTLAAGLAAALSETGDGNVLLVDMNLGKAAVHPFLRGRPNVQLTDLLEPGARNEGQVNEKLFVAKVDESDGKSRPLPTRIHTLMPKMRASDYDYIIFDMPPISETSATVALAASMDQVLLVVEADKTLRPEVKHAHQLLSRYGANVTGIFNKASDSAPKWLAEHA